MIYSTMNSDQTRTLKHQAVNFGVNASVDNKETPYLNRVETSKRL